MRVSGMFSEERDRDALQELNRALFLSPYEARGAPAGRPHSPAERPLAEAIDALKISLWSAGDRRRSHAARARRTSRPRIPTRPAPRRNARSRWMPAHAAGDDAILEQHEVTRAAGTSAVGRGTISAGLTSHTADDGFHEIQLNGKQLVFLFMAATVVSVVIFLCGVLVGRGVRAERGASRIAALVDVPIGRADDRRPPALHLRTRSLRGGRPAAVDDLSYFKRLGEAGQRLDELKQPAPRPPVSDTRQIARAAEPPPAADAPPRVRAPPSPGRCRRPLNRRRSRRHPPPAGSSRRRGSRRRRQPRRETGFAVQLAALNSRSEADAMAKRLSAKGYEAYVQAPATGAPSIFRVRVGNYPTRREAETRCRQAREGRPVQALGRPR